MHVALINTYTTSRTEAMRFEPVLFAVCIQQSQLGQVTQLSCLAKATHVLFS